MLTARLPSRNRYHPPRRAAPTAGAPYPWNGYAHCQPLPVVRSGVVALFSNAHPGLVTSLPVGMVRKGGFTLPRSQAAGPPTTTISCRTFIRFNAARGLQRGDIIPLCCTLHTHTRTRSPTLPPPYTFPARTYTHTPRTHTRCVSAYTTAHC